jgi:alpha-1,6-mannosyltransferase
MREQRRSRSLWLFVIGFALVTLTAGGAALLLLSPPGQAVWFMTTLCIASALWLSAVALVRRGAAPRGAISIVLVVAAAMRIITFATPPLLSTDIYRYVWDGRVQRAGINPYRYVPDAPQLAVLRDRAVFPNINRASYAHTIYPPTAEAIFAAAGFLRPGVYGVKAVMAGFDVLSIGCIAALLRLADRNPAELLIYAWLPLPVWEFAGSGHIDAAATGLMALALLLSAFGRQAPLGITLAAATFTKFLPGVVLPAFWRDGRWKLLGVFGATGIALYLPYLGVGRGVFGFLRGYTVEEGLRSGGGIFLLDVLSRFVSLPHWAASAYFVLVLAVLAALSARFAFSGTSPRSRSQHIECQARRAAILGAVLLVAISPHYPWYFSWLAPLVCLAPLASVLWLLAAAPLLAHDSVEYLIVPLTVYAPAGVLALRDFHKACIRTTSAATNAPEEPR